MFDFMIPVKNLRTNERQVAHMPAKTARLAARKLHLALRSRPDLQDWTIDGHRDWSITVYLEEPPYVR